MLNEMFPAAAALMAQAKEDGLAFRAFPTEHWRKIWSTNLLERINKEIKRRNSVVGIFANNAAIIRLVGALLLEQQIGTAEGMAVEGPMSVLRTGDGQAGQQRQSRPKVT